MANKLLLIEDVEALGRKGEVVSVRPGYARNFLLPQGFAIIADKNALRMQARLTAEREKQAAIDKKESEAIAARLEGLILTKIVKVDHEGHMYGSVTNLDIVHMLTEQSGITLERKTVQLPHALKEVGVFPIKIKLKEGIISTITLKVVPENAKGDVLAPATEAEAEAQA